MNEEKLFEEVESSIQSLAQNQNQKKRLHFGDWEERFLEEPKKFMDSHNHLRREDLKSFRARHAFVADRPVASLRFFYSSNSWFYNFMKICNQIIGRRRGGIREALDIFDVVDRMNYLHLLKKYPTPEIGRPLIINHRGYKFTFRYIRHIYLLGLFLEKLRNQLTDDAIFLDIGSSYGIFSSLLKKEMPRSRHVLVDLDGQLILAHYYLRSLFPEAKIASFVDSGKATVIDREFIKRYDFVLVPTDMFEKMNTDSVEVLTNFISFFEMSREWYFKYINSNVFTTAPYIYTVNRYDAYPTYHNDLTFLDFPFQDYETLFVRTCPFLKFYYESFLFFWYKSIQYPSEFFQFIGRRKAK